MTMNLKLPLSLTKRILFMNKNILERYTQTENGRYIIDINAAKISDLYNDFDKQAPSITKSNRRHFILNDAL